MRYYTCFYRHRDNNGKIVGYTIRSEESFEWMQVTPEQLKDAILNKRVTITNLKLTSDGRLTEQPNKIVSAPEYTNNTGRDLRNLQLLSEQKIVNDNEDLGYMHNQSREDNMNSRVKFDAVFEVNKLARLFSFGRAGKTKKASTKGYSGEDEYTDIDDAD